MHSIRSLELFLRRSSSTLHSPNGPRLFDLPAWAYCRPCSSNGEARRDHLFSVRQINKSPRYDHVRRSCSILTVIRKIRNIYRVKEPRKVSVSSHKIGKSTGKFEKLLGFSSFFRQFRLLDGSFRCSSEKSRDTSKRHQRVGNVGSEILTLTRVIGSRNSTLRLKCPPIDCHKLRKNHKPTQLKHDGRVSVIISRLPIGSRIMKRFFEGGRRVVVADIRFRRLRHRMLIRSLQDIYWNVKSLLMSQSNLAFAV